MKWKLEAWHRLRRRWVGLAITAYSYEAAKEAVCMLAAKGTVAQATLVDPAPDAFHCMRAFPGKGWWCWTGSGGLK